MASGDSNESNMTEDVNSTDSDKAAAGSSSGSNNYSGKYLRSLFLKPYVMINVKKWKL